MLASFVWPEFGTASRLIVSLLITLVGVAYGYWQWRSIFRGRIARLEDDLLFYKTSYERCFADLLSMIDAGSQVPPRAARKQTPSPPRLSREEKVRNLSMRTDNVHEAKVAAAIAAAMAASKKNKAD